MRFLATVAMASGVMLVGPLPGAHREQLGPLTDALDDAERSATALWQRVAELPPRGAAASREERDASAALGRAEVEAARLLDGTPGLLSDDVATELVRQLDAARVAMAEVRAAREAARPRQMREAAAGLRRATARAASLMRAQDEDGP